MFTVSLIEDDDTDRKMLSRLIRSSKLCRLLSAHATAEAALEHLPHDKPDVALVDVNLPGMDGIECIRRLRAIKPALPTRFIILTGHEDDDSIFAALKAGAKGYILKSYTSSKKILVALKEVMAGGVPLTPSIAQKVIATFEEKVSDVTGLSKREREVLQRIAQGMMDKEICSELAISRSTVRTYVASIYDKLHIRSRAAAAVYFSHQGPRQ